MGMGGLMAEGISDKQVGSGGWLFGLGRCNGPIVTLLRTLCLGLTMAVMVPPAVARDRMLDAPMTLTLADSPADRQRQKLLEGGDRTIYAAGNITDGTTAGSSLS